MVLRNAALYKLFALSKKLVKLQCLTINFPKQKMRHTLELERNRIHYECLPSLYQPYKSSYCMFSYFRNKIRCYKSLRCSIVGVRGMSSDSNNGESETGSFGYVDSTGIDLKPSLKSKHIIRQPVKNTKDIVDKKKTDKDIVDKKKNDKRKPNNGSKAYGDFTLYARFDSPDDNLDHDREHQQPIGMRTFRQNNHYKKRISDFSNDFGHQLDGMGSYQYKKSKQVKTAGVKGEILFGLFPVLLALKTKSRLCHRLYIKHSKLASMEDETNNSDAFKEIMQLAEERGLDVVPCKGKLLTVLSGDRPHQGVCLDVSKKVYEPLNTANLQLETENPQNGCKVWLYLQSIQDPMNFGAILRTSYYLGVNKLLCSEKDSCGLTPVVSKASCGALELQSIYSVEDLTAVVKHLKERGWNIVGTIGTDENLHREKLQDLQNVTLSQNTLLLLGNEGSGLSSEAVSLCDTLLTIMPRQNIHRCVDSLNVSVATGIILHHLIKTRKST